MTDDSTFIPRHIREGAHIGPPDCEWHKIITGYERCFEPQDMITGVRLCKTHIRRIAKLAGHIAPHQFRKELDEAMYWERVNHRAEVDQLERTVRWQAKRLRGEVANEPAPTPQTERATTGTVYFLRVGGYIKIGWTSDLNKRMRNGYHPDSQLLAVKPGTRADERAIHRKHAHLITHGREWFPMAPQILEEIEAAKREHGEPPAVLFSASAHKARALGTAPDTRAGDYPIGKSTG